MVSRTLVVGAGLGGLAAAIRLARRGAKVTVVERNSRSGGKAWELERDGFRWDAGPSLLTMPHVVREVFEIAGAQMEEEVELVRLPSACRYFWSDGTTIDEDAAFWQQREAARFLKYARGIHELAGEGLLRPSPKKFWRALSAVNLRKLRHLPKLTTPRSMAGVIGSFFSDPHLQQIFQRFATEQGSSPFRTPAAFNILPFLRAEFGAWQVRGGMARLAEAMERVARRLGVEFIHGATAAEWKARELILADGRRLRADLLVCNGDAISSQHGFLRRLVDDEDCAALRKPAISTSGFLLFLGVRRRYPQLAPHNVFFSDDYPAEFTSLFKNKVVPTQPTLSVSISARAAEGDAPAGQDNYVVYAPAPARSLAEPWTGDEIPSYRDVVLDRLEAFGLEGLRGEIVVEQAFTPTDFARRDLSWQGSFHGWAAHSLRSALLRPPQRIEVRPGEAPVYFVGGTTQPGGGIPFVLLSAKMAVEEMARRKEI